MASKNKRWTGSAAAAAQVWGFSPPVNSNAPTWSLTLNGKTLSVLSNGTAADAVTQMQTVWSNSQEPEFREIQASVPISGLAATNPGGAGTNEIQAVYITGTPTGGSYQLAWGGQSTPFVLDPTGTLTAADSGSAGNPNGSYKYTVTFLNYNALGVIGETKVSSEATVTVTNHSINLTGIPTAAAGQGCIARRIYRTAGGGGTGTEKLMATIWDNSTTTYTDNIADGSLGANQPTANTTGIPYNATATQLQAILQGLQPIAPNNTVVTGSGTTASPWLCQFTNALGALQQTLIKAGSQSFNYTATVPAGIIPQVVVSEIQQGVPANTTPPSDGNHLLLVGTLGQPFYLTSTVTGVIPPVLNVNQISGPPPAPEHITVTENTPTIAIASTATGRPGTNAAFQITISPNAEAGSTYTVSWGGNTTA
ncbi:MAG TPA: hypothetical protein VGP68_08810, partial [Gemmataceae bacterium]|nr:hypothetical protein [Gemmataceae bacterium]